MNSTVHYFEIAEIIAVENARFILMYLYLML